MSYILTFRLPSDFYEANVLPKFIEKFTNYLTKINQVVRTRVDASLTLKSLIPPYYQVLLGPDGFVFQRIDKNFENVSIGNMLIDLFKNSEKLNPSAMARLIFRTLWDLTRDYSVERHEMLKILEKIPIL